MDKIIFIGLIVVLFIIVFCLIRYIKRERNKTYNELRKQYEEELEKELQDTTKKIAEAKSELTSSTEEASKAVQRLQEVSKELQEKEQFNKQLYRIREEELNNLIEVKKKAEFEKADREIEEWISSAQEAAGFESAMYQQSLQNEVVKKKKELNDLTDMLDDYKARRDVINQEILRARAIEEKQDFYRIQLDDSSKEDIAFLLSITDRFNNKEIIYKLIWSEYIQKPFKNMTNRVLGNKDPKNVIYMIKNMDTNEIYIGKTKAEVSKRWTEHVKTSLNIGTISRTNIHKALFNNWDKFAFTVLEEVPAETNLGNREKYYIKFYESDVFGYNIKSGG